MFRFHILKTKVSPDKIRIFYEFLKQKRNNIHILMPRQSAAIFVIVLRFLRIREISCWCPRSRGRHLQNENIEYVFTNIYIYLLI